MFAMLTVLAMIGVGSNTSHHPVFKVTGLRTVCYIYKLNLLANKAELSLLRPSHDVSWLKLESSFSFQGDWPANILLYIELRFRGRLLGTLGLSRLTGDVSMDKLPVDARLIRLFSRPSSRVFCCCFW